jgi:hypothetical protein
MGYTPYYLLYGQHLLMPYDVKDKTFHSLDWPAIKSTEDLLALRIVQLSKRDNLLETAVQANERSRLKAAEAFNQKHAMCMATGEYHPGKWVIVYNKALDNQHGSKGTAKWFGPYIVQSISFFACLCVIMCGVAGVLVGLQVGVGLWLHRCSCALGLPNLEWKITC